MQSLFGLLGGIGAHPEDLMHMRRTAERLLGEDYQWSILGAGRNQMPLATIGAAMALSPTPPIWDGTRDRGPRWRVAVS